MTRIPSEYPSSIIENVKVFASRDTKIDIKLEKTFIEFDPIVVSAGKTKQRLEQTPISLSVVTSKDIKRRNATNIIENCCRRIL